MPTVGTILESLRYEWFTFADDHDFDGNVGLTFVHNIISFENLAKSADSQKIFFVAFICEEGVVPNCIISLLPTRVSCPSTAFP